MQGKQIMDNKKYNSDYARKMSLLKEYDYDKFMRVLYKSFEEYPERVARDPYPMDTKVKALNKVMTYFEDVEEYEKCVVIKTILNGIKEKDISSDS